MLMRLLKSLVLVSILVFFGLIVGCGGKQEVLPDDMESGNYEEEITLYFSDVNADYLTPETRTVQVPDTDCVTLATVVIEELIAGPQEDSGLYGIMPEGTEWRSVNLEEDGVLLVDLNQAFIDNQPGGSASMGLTLYGLVNSLTQLQGIDAVQIIIDGQKVDAYQGMIRADEPIFPRVEYVQWEA